jgi:lysyl-tRNA synthetase class 2
MKRLLADGYPDIYEICRVFREGESGRLHQPEFTMVEWYRHGFGLGAMIDETVAFIADLLQQPELADAEWLEYETAFRRFANIESRSRPRWTNSRMPRMLTPACVRVSETIGTRGWTCCLVRASPRTSLASGSRCCGIDRFEVFHGAVELANGFVELRDANEQRQRMHADLARRRASARRPVPLDEPLLAALESGLPECAGVAVGFERLLMLATGAADIRDVLTFALDDKDD